MPIDPVSAKPCLTLIAAMTRNRVIGADGGMPWDLPADMRYFIDQTRGKPIVTGRRNLEAVGGALPGRHNIVLSRQAGLAYPGCELVDTPEAALTAAGSVPEIMIIGGEEIYRLFLPLAHRIRLTVIDTEMAGDTHFPEITADQWQEVERTHYPADANNAYAMDFLVLDRAT